MISQVEIFMKYKISRKELTIQITEFSRLPAPQNLKAGKSFGK